MHDARVGRFLSIDPLAAKYPHNSPYAFSENRVIDARELEGLEAWIMNTNEIKAGPFTDEYAQEIGLKPIQEVVTSDELVTAVMRGQLSSTFVANQKAADLYSYTTIRNDELGTFTIDNRTSADVNIDMNVQNPDRILTRVAFELNNAAGSRAGVLSALQDGAATGVLSKEEYVRGIMRHEATSKIKELLVRHETGIQKMDRNMYQEYRTRTDYYVEMMSDMDYDGGTRETSRGTELGRDLYGAQYDRIRERANQGSDDH